MMNRFVGPFFIFPWELKKQYCQICKCGHWGQLKIVKHHYSYFPPKIIRICHSCHNKIHGKVKGIYERWQPPAYDASKFYGKQQLNFKEINKRKQYLKKWKDSNLDNN